MNEFSTKNITDLKDLLGKLNGEYVTKQEFIKAFQIFKGVLDEMKNMMDAHHGRMMNLTSSTIDGQNRNIKGIQDGFSKISTNVSSNFVSHIEGIKGEISKLQESIQGNSNEIKNSKVDLTPYDGKLKSIQQEMMKSLTAMEAKMSDKMKEGEIKKEIDDLKSTIKDLNDKITQVGKTKGTIGGMRKVPIVKPYSLTSQCDSSTKTFTVPKDTTAILAVFGSSFPINYDPFVDWTFSGNKITLDSKIPAPETSQTMWALIETLFYY